MSQPAEPEPGAVPATLDGRVRRAPLYRRFAVTGVVVGVVLAVIAVQFATPTRAISRVDIGVYLVAMLGFLGGLLGLLAAVLVERRQ